MTHVIIDANGIKCHEWRFNGEAEVINKFLAVRPRDMAVGTCLVYCWLPGRIDPTTGKPLETDRLREFIVPISKDGPMVNQVSKLIDEAMMPTRVRVEPIEIPPEIQAITDHNALADLAMRVGIQLPRDGPIKLKQSLIAQQCHTKRGKDVLERIRAALKNLATGPTPEEIAAESAT